MGSPVRIRLPPQKKASAIAGAFFRIGSRLSALRYPIPKPLPSGKGLAAEAALVASLRISLDCNAKSIIDIILMLQSRGLVISDTDKAADFLKKVSYFRFAAYLRQSLSSVPSLRFVGPLPDLDHATFNGLRSLK